MILFSLERACQEDNVTGACNSLYVDNTQHVYRMLSSLSSTAYPKGHIGVQNAVFFQKCPWAKFRLIFFCGLRVVQQKRNASHKNNQKVWKIFGDPLFGFIHEVKFHTHTHTHTPASDRYYWNGPTWINLLASNLVMSASKLYVWKIRIYGVKRRHTVTLNFFSKIRNGYITATFLVVNLMTANSRDVTAYEIKIRHL
jgi:hypothetical protein